MNKTQLLFIALIFAATWTHAQTYKISGKVVNTTNQIIPFANILLLKSADSTFVKGTSADENGTFLLEEVNSGLYLLQASYVGRGSKPQALDIKADVKLGALVIPTNVEELDEVVVTAKRPTLQRLPDRLVFKVENTVVSQGTTWDILKSSPGLIVTQDELQVRGRVANVYLNGRRIQLSEDETKSFLESLSGVAIQSVEMYTNPPANFDAEEGAVINIITNRAVAPGYKGSIEGAFTQAIFPKYRVGTSHYFQSEKLNLFANYTYNDKKNNRQVEKGINFIDNTNTVFSRWQTDDNQIRNEVSHGVNFSLDHEIDPRNSINLTSNLLLTPNQDWSRNLFADIRNSQNQIDSTFTTLNTGMQDEQNLAFDFAFKHKLKKPGAKLSVNGHYTNYNDKYIQNIRSNYFGSTGNFLREFGFTTDGNQNIQIFTGQLDFQTPIGTSSLEAGLKLSRVDSESSIDFFDFSGNDDLVQSAQADDFLYNETVYAAYASYVKSWEKWSMKLGLRAELTDATGTSLTLNEVNTQDFFEPFPTLYLLYSPNEKNSFSFDYGRNVQRPRYNDLNPFQYFYNENDFEEGNPTLQPNFTNNFNLNYTWNSELFFDLYYRDNGNYISTLGFQDNRQLTLRELKQNVLSSNSYGFDITYNKSIIDPWFFYAYASFFHEDETFLAVESVDETFTNEVDGFYIYLANYLTLSGDGSLTGEVAFSHITSYLIGSYVQQPRTTLTFGLRKSFWKDRAILSVSAEDLLGRAMSENTSRYLNQDNFFFSQPETQFVRFGFTYNFGNFRLEENQRDITKDERDRL